LFCNIVWMVLSCRLSLVSSVRRHNTEIPAGCMIQDPRVALDYVIDLVGLGLPG